MNLTTTMVGGQRFQRGKENGKGHPLGRRGLGGTGPVWPRHRAKGP